MKNETLPTQKIEGYSVQYSGERLDQFDADVWLVLVSIARDFGLGSQVPITLRGIAGRVGIGTAGEDIQRVRKSLDRMVEGTVILRAGRRHEFKGHLVSSFARVDDRYVITLDPDLVGIFAPDQFTLLLSDSRMALDSPLSKWLHGFLATQTAPERFAHKVETLRDLCGSETKDLKNFRPKLRAALADLQERDVITSWSIDPEYDLVRVKRKGSDSQQRAVKKSEARANRVRLAQMQRERDGERGGGLRRL